MNERLHRLDVSLPPGDYVVTFDRSGRLIVVDGPSPKSQAQIKSEILGVLDRADAILSKGQEQP